MVSVVMVEIAKQVSPSALFCSGGFYFYLDAIKKCIEIIPLLIT